MRNLFGILDQFKDLFGKPRTGVHSYRWKDNAMVDYMLTLVLAMLITYATDIPLVLTTIFAFILGIIVHYLVGIKTNSIAYIENLFQ